MDALIQMLIALFQSGDGVVALLGLMVIGLIYWVTSRTVSKDLYKESNKKIDKLSAEFRDTVGPTLDRMTRIMEKQDQINNNLMRQVDEQQKILSEMSKDLSIVSHELKMQRLEGRRSNKDDDSG